MRLEDTFYQRDCLLVAPDLVGKLLVRTLPDGTQITLRIAETEAYRGEEDTACHAHKGRTKRTQILYAKAAPISVSLCCGIHGLLNVVSGEETRPRGSLHPA